MIFGTGTIKKHRERKLKDYIFSKIFGKYYRSKLNSNTLLLDNQSLVPEKNFSIKNQNFPIFSNYRFSIKRGWTFYPPLKFLNFLRNINRLDQKGKSVLNSAIGDRTLNMSLTEIWENASPIILKNKEFFTFSKTNIPLYINPTISEVNSRIKYFSKCNKAILKKLKSSNLLPNKTNLSLLEIGFTSGGYSLFSWEKLGISVFGIDNYYGGNSPDKSLAHNIHSILQSKANLIIGDITSSDLSNEKFDIIFSTSVIEHIIDLRKATSEMFRLLKPGGVAVHSYHPYFCESGGHSLAIADFPWGHIQMSPDEFKLYLKELRPYEYKYASNWLDRSLNKLTPAQVQHAFINAGFNIYEWEESCTQFSGRGNTQLAFLNSLRNFPGLRLQDLYTDNIFFVAQKV